MKEEYVRYIKYFCILRDIYILETSLKNRQNNFDSFQLSAIIQQEKKSAITGTSAIFFFASPHILPVICLSLQYRYTKNVQY